MDKAAPAAGCFKHVERTDHIYHSTANGVGGATRDLEAGQVQHVGDSLVEDRPFDIGDDGYIPLNESDLRELVCGQQRRQPCRSGVDIQNMGTSAAIDEFSYDPAADKTFGSGDEKAMRGIIVMRVLR